MGATPPVVDRSSESSSNGKAKGHTDHRGEPGCSPRSLVEKSQRDGIVGTLGEVRDEVNPLTIDGSTCADGDDDEAHARRDVTVLMATRVSRNREVSSQSRAIGVVSSNVVPHSKLL